MKRKRAIKIMRPSLVGEIDALQRFTREAVNPSQPSHPNIAAILDFSETDGVVDLAMAYVADDSLAATLNQDDTMHPAVKPDNIMLGTPQYMSPDQRAGDTRDARSDPCSLAPVAFFALTGKPALPAESSKESLVARLTKGPQTLQNAKQDVRWPDSLQEIFDTARARADPAMPAGVAHTQATVDDNAPSEAMKREKTAAADRIDDIRVNIMPTPVFLWRAQQITTWKDANSKAAGGLYDTVDQIEGWSERRTLVPTQRAAYVVEVTPDKVPWPSLAPERHSRSSRAPCIWSR